MKRAANKWKQLFLLAGLGVGLLVLLACTTGNGTPIPTDQSEGSQDATGTDLNQLLAALDSVSESGTLAQQISRLQSGGTISTGNTGIWVNGRGEATGTPDLAILNLGIEALADTVSEARNQAATAMEGTVAALRAHGIADQDIQTNFFNISPSYTNREVKRCPAARELGADQEQTSSTQIVRPDAPPAVEPTPIGAPVPQPIVVVIEDSEVKADRLDESCFTTYERVIVGYVVNNQLTVKVRDLDSTGAIIDQVTEAGGDLTRFQGISFTIEDNEALQDEARVAAIEDLLSKSGQVANLTGVKLGQLVYITESGSPIHVRIESAPAFAASDMAVRTPIMAGELTVVVTMQAVFEIQGPGS